MSSKDNNGGSEGEGQVSYPRLNFGDLYPEATPQNPDNPHQYLSTPSVARTPSPQIHYPTLPITETHPFTRKVVLVTGASWGIGRTIALHLAERGALIVAQYHASFEGACQLVDEVEALSVNLNKSITSIVAVHADLSRADDVEKLFEQGKALFTKIDIVVSTFERDIWGHVSEITEEEIDRAFEANFKSQVLVAQQARHHVSEHGCLILTSGNMVQTGAAGSHSIYRASSAAVESLIHNLSADPSYRNVHVNGIVPGHPADAKKPGEPGNLSRSALTPLHLESYHREVARVVAYLCDGDGASMNAHTISVDYGTPSS